MVLLLLVVLLCFLLIEIWRKQQRWRLLRNIMQGGIWNTASIYKVVHIFTSTLRARQWCSTDRSLPLCCWLLFSSWSHAAVVEKLSCLILGLLGIVLITLYSMYHLLLGKGILVQELCLLGVVARSTWQFTLEILHCRLEAVDDLLIFSGFFINLLAPSDVIQHELWVIHCTLAYIGIFIII